MENILRRSPEKLEIPKRGENIGFQARFLMGPAYLNPETKTKSKIGVEDFNITPESYKPFEVLSTLERQTVWKDREGNDHERQKQAWATKVVSVVQSRQGYFESEEGKRSKYLYEKLDIQMDGFNQASAIAMYDRFFAPERRGNEVSRFVDDVISLDEYKDPEKEDIVNFDKVKEDLEAFGWLGTIFGVGSGLMLPELIAAEARFFRRNSHERLVKELNHKEHFYSRETRKDKLNDYEKGLLEYSQNANQRGELLIPLALSQYFPDPETYMPQEQLLPVAPPQPTPPPGFIEQTIELISRGRRLAGRAGRYVGTAIGTVGRYLGRNRESHANPDEDDTD